MIIIDTNVISELMRKVPSPEVERWIDANAGSSLWTTTVSVMELRFGIEASQSELRRSQLAAILDRLSAVLFQNRLIAFDEPAARAAATLQADRKRQGLGSEIRDQMIAGIVLSRGATLATRNVRHFGDAGIRLVNPFEPGQKR